VAELFLSYSQHGEDVVLWRALGDRAEVVYVDVGAFHPSDDSVTRALYERGWRGVNIEPHAELVAVFDRDRPEDTNLAVAVGDHDGTIVLRPGKRPGWSTTVGGSEVDAVVDGDAEPIEVPLRRLSSLLPELGVDKVDALKVDVEGAEVGVVRGLLDGPLRPTVCVIEGVSPVLGRAPGDAAVGLLMDAGYHHCMFDGINHWLTVDEALVPALSVPANPLDGFVKQVPRGVEEFIVADPVTGEPVHTVRLQPDELPTLVESLHAGLTPEQVVEQLFLVVLGRVPDPVGIRSWAQDLEAGEDVVVVAQRLALQFEALERPLEVRALIAEQIEALRVRRLDAPDTRA
jgi:FkbM family methyltransferase